MGFIRGSSINRDRFSRYEPKAFGPRTAENGIPIAVPAAGDSPRLRGVRRSSNTFNSRSSPLPSGQPPYRTASRTVFPGLTRSAAILTKPRGSA
jgi:hypothetical protein